jgi:hypothetical protein
MRLKISIGRQGAEATIVLPSAIVVVPVSVEQDAIHRPRVTQDSLLAMYLVPAISLLTCSRTDMQ